MSREAAFSALFQRGVAPPIAWGLASRRMKLWSEVPASLRPALFQLESGPETYQWTSLATPRRSSRPSCFSISTRATPRRPAPAPSTKRSTRSMRRWRRAGSDVALGRQTLGGVVYDCRIVGVPVRDTGDLDGDGLAVVSVRLVGP